MDEEPIISMLNTLAWAVLGLCVAGALFVGVTMGRVESAYGDSEINTQAIVIAAAVLMQGMIAFALMRAAAIVVGDLRAARNSLARMEPKAEPKKQPITPLR